MNQEDPIPEILRAARSYIGVPFHHAGRNHSGVDCVGLEIAAMRDAGYTTWDDTAYSRIVDPERMKREIELFCSPVLPVCPSVICAGDVLFFSIRGTAQHLGIVDHIDGEEVWFLHAYEGVGRVVLQRMDEKWRRRLHALYRLDLTKSP